MIMHISNIEISDKEVVFKTKPQCEHWSQHTWLRNSACFLPALCAVPGQCYQSYKHKDPYNCTTSHLFVCKTPPPSTTLGVRGIASAMRENNGTGNLPLGMMNSKTQNSSFPT
jgi:hypothetical protein